MSDSKTSIDKIELTSEMLEGISGGVIVNDGDGERYWLVRQNGTVISPVPSLEKAKEFISAYGESPRVISREEYKKIYGKDLVW